MGSLLFALGAVPGYASAVGARWDAVTFFIGSLFFTAAGFLTYREAVDAGPRTPGSAHRHFFVFQPHRIDWWATAIQLAGTLWFNISTGNALREDLSAQAAHQHVWRPDAFGSVAFLVASALAWFEVCHGWAAWRPRSLSWWITLPTWSGPSPSACPPWPATSTRPPARYTTPSGPTWAPSSARCASSRAPCC